MRLVIKLIQGVSRTKSAVCRLPWWVQSGGGAVINVLNSVHRRLPQPWGEKHTVEFDLARRRLEQVLETYTDVTRFPWYSPSAIKAYAPQTYRQFISERQSIVTCQFHCTLALPYQASVCGFCQMTIIPSGQDPPKFQSDLSIPFILSMA